MAKFGDIVGQNRRTCLGVTFALISSSLISPSVRTSAQMPVSTCKDYLKFQIRLNANVHQSKTLPSAESLQALVGAEPLIIVSVLPFDLRSETNNTISLLIIVWDGGLKAGTVERFAASLRKEERLHLRISVLTRHNGESPWTDDPATQRKSLDEAALESSSFPADKPGHLLQTSDERVVESRWEERLRTSIEDTIKQPGKQAILELLPPPPLRPPEGAEHWRIPADRDYAGEPQVHTFAALGLIPVYRVHNQTPALTMIIPGGDASYSPPLAAGGNISGSTLGQEQLSRLQETAMPPAFPPASRVFSDLGGKDVFEARDALTVIQADLEHVYSVVAKTPVSCTPRGVARLRMGVSSAYQSAFTLSNVPSWAAFYLLERERINDDVHDALRR